jgi:hypothetical protein
MAALQLPWHMVGWCRQHRWRHTEEQSRQHKLACLSPTLHPSSPRLKNENKPPDISVFKQKLEFLFINIVSPTKMSDALSAPWADSPLSLPPEYNLIWHVELKLINHFQADLKALRDS